MACGPFGTVGRLAELVKRLSELLARQVQASVEFWRSPVGTVAWRQCAAVARPN
ncbi:MAG: hypothetical protein KatS3mg111_3980 [Pirellulaceae bacterium]|nr:MAG: hypothetical protein KatS3mg111_3980 [Pirellulaceae bacterium]